MSRGRNDGRRESVRTSTGRRDSGSVCWTVDDILYSFCVVLVKSGRSLNDFISLPLAVHLESPQSLLVSSKVF